MYRKEGVVCVGEGRGVWEGGCGRGEGVVCVLGT